MVSETPNLPVVHEALLPESNPPIFSGGLPTAYIKLCSERNILRICEQSIYQEKNYEL